SPSHNYTTAGAFTVKLISTTAFGCKDSNTKALNVRPQTIPAFSINNNSQCLRGNSFVFSNTTTGALTYQWKFGDATTSTATSPSHSYAAAGAFTVKLFATTNYGCLDSAIKTLDVRAHPVTSFTINDTDQCLSGNNFSFSNTSSNYTIQSWKFGDAGTSALTSPSHSYLGMGSFVTKLVTRNSYNCSDSLSKRVYVRPHPTTSFSINDSDQCLSGNNVVFTNASLGASSYVWKFGDASSSALTSPSHKFLSNGIFAVKLISTNVYTCKDSAIKSVYIRALPVVNIMVNDSDQCLSGNSFAFSNSSAVPYTYNWKFGDASFSGLATPTHSYADSGIFKVKLIATNSFSCTYSTIKTVYVRKNPKTQFSINDSDQCLIGNNFVLTNTTSAISNSLWKFGDANTSTIISPSHTYSLDGTYTISLLTTNAFSCSDSTTKTVYIRQMPKSSFTVNDSDQCLSGNNFIFSNASTGATTYLWKLGDGNTSTSNSKNYTYSNAGNYNVKLVGYNFYNCADTFTKSVYIRPLPFVSFSINDNTQCFKGNNFNFTNLTAGNNTYLWKLGDNQTSTDTNTSHVYSKSGWLYVKLIARNSFGCFDSLIKPIKIYPDITITKKATNILCFSGNNGSIDINPITGVLPFSYLWSTGSNLSKISNLKAGKYMLTINDSAGCSYQDS
ncbi:MAG: PKD domain-containing protein, partial [Paludibacter sp.]